MKRNSLDRTEPAGIHSSIQTLRTRVAESARRVGIPIPSPSHEHSVLIDSIAFASRYMDDNRPPSLESMLSFVRAGKRAQGDHWSQSVDPGQRFLQTVVEEQRAAEDLQNACSSYVTSFSFKDYKPTKLGISQGEKDALSDIRNIASRLEPSSRIPLADDQDSSDWQNPETLELYVKHVARLPKGPGLHSELTRSAIQESLLDSTRDGAKLTEPEQSLWLFMDKCDTYYQLDIGNERAKVHVLWSECLNCTFPVRFRAHVYFFELYVVLWDHLYVLILLRLVPGKA